MRLGAHENLSKRSVQMDMSTGGRAAFLFIPSNDEVHVRNVNTGMEEMSVHSHYQNVNACVYLQHYQVSEFEYSPSMINLEYLQSLLWN